MFARWRRLPTCPWPQLSLCPITDPTRLDIDGNPTTQLVNIPTLAYQITFPGGDTQAVLNAEYRIPIAGPVTVSGFMDHRHGRSPQEESVAAQPGCLRVVEFAISRCGTDQRVAAGCRHQFPFESFHRGGVGRESAGPECSVPALLVLQFPAACRSRSWRPASIFNVPNSVKQGLPFDVYESQIQPQINNLLVNPSTN